MIMMMLLMITHLLVHLREQVLLVLKLPQHSLKHHDHQHWLQNSIEMHYDALFCQEAQGHIQKGLGRMRKVI